MPLGGKLVLKGGETLAGSVQKKTKKKGKKDAPAAEEQQGEEGGEQQPGSNKPKPIAPTAVNVLSGKNYEAEFEFETKRMQEGRARSNPWGATYRAAPEILHGYTKKVKGDTAEERLDMRAATKADRYCK